MATKSRAVKAPAKPAAKAVAKLVAKPAVKKTPVRAAPKPAAKSTVPASVQRAVKRAVKLVPAAAKPVLVRDSFTMPEAEYAVLAAVKQQCLKAGVEIKKSELLRIGVALVGQLDLASLRAVLASLPQLKTGRPRSVPNA